MNIMQYRAMKAQEAQQGSQVVDQPKVDAPVVNEPKPVVTEPKVDEPKVPEKITIDGIGEVTLDELKNGYLRQSDYTQKTQDVARQKREVQDAVTFYEQIKKNPELVNQIKDNTPIPPTLDPVQAKVMELENRVYDMLLQQEINALQNKYKDFEIKEVLEVASEKGITNLEDAYLIASSRKNTTPSPVNEEELKKKLREELLKELEAEKNATHTIISSNGTTAPIDDNSPKLTEAEKKVAKMMRLSELDYVKWRDAGKSNKK